MKGLTPCCAKENGVGGSGEYNKIKPSVISYEWRCESNFKLKGQSKWTIKVYHRLARNASTISYSFSNIGRKYYMEDEKIYEK